MLFVGDVLLAERGLTLSWLDNGGVRNRLFAQQRKSFKWGSLKNGFACVLILSVQDSYRCGIVHVYHW